MSSRFAGGPPWHRRATEREMSRWSKNPHRAGPKSQLTCPRRRFGWGVPTWRRAVGRLSLAPKPTEGVRSSPGGRSLRQRPRTSSLWRRESKLVVSYRYLPVFRAEVRADKSYSTIPNRREGRGCPGQTGLREALRGSVGDGSGGCNRSRRAGAPKARSAEGSAATWDAMARRRFVGRRG